MVSTGFPDGASGKEPACLGREDPLEKEIATHSSILAWRIPWTEEPGGLQSMELQSQTRLKRLSRHTCSHMIPTFPSLILLFLIQKNRWGKKGDGM